MKKLLPIALLAALSCSFVACSEGDVACFEPSYNKLIKDMGKIRGADKELSSIANVEEAVQPCKDFAEDVEKIVNANKEVTGDSIKAEWTDFKGTSTTCKIKNGAGAILTGLTFPQIYSNIEKNVKYCSELTVGGAAVVGEGLTTSFTTMSGWHGILQQAADMTVE